MTGMESGLLSNVSNMLPVSPTSQSFPLIICRYPNSDLNPLKKLNVYPLIFLFLEKKKGMHLYYKLY